MGLPFDPPYFQDPVPVAIDNILLYEGMKHVGRSCTDIFDSETGDYGQRLLTLIIPFTAVISVLSALQLRMLLQFTKMKYEIMSLFWLAKKQCIDSCIEFLEHQRKSIQNQKSDLMESFNFNIVQYESALARGLSTRSSQHKSGTTASSSSNTKEVAQGRLQLPKFSLIDWQPYCVIACLLVAFILVMFLQYRSQVRFMQQFNRSSKVFAQFSNARIYPV